MQIVDSFRNDRYRVLRHSCQWNGPKKDIASAFTRCKHQRKQQLFAGALTNHGGHGHHRFGGFDADFLLVNFHPGARKAGGNAWAKLNFQEAWQGPYFRIVAGCVLTRFSWKFNGLVGGTSTL